MSVEPEDIRYREFRRSVRGYSPDEVDDLLDSLADELESVLSERDTLAAELDEARIRIEHFESLEGSIRATLEQAEKAASDYQDAARREAESIIRDAERRSRGMLAESHSKVERAQDSYEALRQARHSFDADFRRLLKGYLGLLDEANSDTAREIEAPLNERLDLEAIAAARQAAEQEKASSHPPDDEEVSRIEVRGGREASYESEQPGVSGDSAAEDEPEPPETRRGRFVRRRG